MKKILLVFGTRPEAVKMCPLVKVLREEGTFLPVVCVTGQHRAMLWDALSAFGILPDIILDVFSPAQSLSRLSERLLSSLSAVLQRERPDLVLLHGDTTTAFCTALACFYERIPFGHVEAGLRTYHMDNPFPEELNRRAIALMARLHFAPTEAARANLLREGVKEADIFVTGNTAIDAVKMLVRTDYQSPHLAWAEGKRLLLLTAHRRESLGEPLRAMLLGVKGAVLSHPDTALLYPMHENPAVQRVARAVFAGCDRVRLIPPLPVFDFQNILARCYLVITDSGGLQEEAPALKRPVLVLREHTERSEGEAVGCVLRVGTRTDAVRAGVTRLLEDSALYAAMQNAGNPYGDGNAARRILRALHHALT